MVTRDPNVPPGNQPILATLNPLVDQGIDAGQLQNSFPIVMEGGLSQLTAPPGLPQTAEGTTTSPTRVDGWDNDAEGVGNPRIYPHPGYSAIPIIDIGADEMCPLIMAGFINGTRILTPEPVPNAPAVNALSNHGRFYFFARMEFNPHSRPQTNIYDAKVLTDWWGGVQSNPAPDADAGNYTTVALGLRPGGTTAERRQDIVVSGFFYEPIMRGLECDFTPHLAPDPHPFWGLWMTIPPNQALWSDVYASNPWYDHMSRPPSVPLRRDNPCLFHNAGGSSSTSWFGAFGGPSGVFVVDATLNPPGTYPHNVTGATRWTLAPTATFGPYAPCPGTSPTTFSVNVWGFGDVALGCPDLVPYMGTQLVSAARFNCERIVNGAATSNLQTQLGIRGPQPPQGAGPPEQGARIAPTVKPTVDEVRRIVRTSLERRL
jgi:hypothetical protein